MQAMDFMQGRIDEKSFDMSELQMTVLSRVPECLLLLALQHLRARHF